MAKPYARTIRPGFLAPPPTAKMKFGMAWRKPASIGGFSAALFSAGWSHLNDNRPHYGTDSAAFGERFGAAYLRQASQSFFNYGLYSTLFRTDPRYYVLGPTHTFRRRAIYAASRSVITRSDSGKNVPNFALILGSLSASALSNAYFPDRDRDADRTLLSVLTGLATRAGTQEFTEFSGEILRVLHLKKRDK